MCGCGIQLLAEERMEAVGVWDMDCIESMPVVLGVVNPGVVSDGHVLSICRNGNVWVRES